MVRLKLILAAMFAVIISLAATAPAWAALYYDPDTNTWVERTILQGHGKGSSIVRTTVPYDTKFKPGTIVIETSERYLYFVLPGGRRAARSRGSARTSR